MNQSDNEPTIGVLYNNQYGGYGLSDKAIQLYNEKMSRLDPEYKPIKFGDDKVDEDYSSISFLEYERHNPVLVEIYKEIGKEINDDCSNIVIKEIPKKYKKCYTISEYDGLESICIDLQKYTVKTIKKIIKNLDMDNDTKIEEINKVFLETDN